MSSPVWWQTGGRWPFSVSGHCATCRTQRWNIEGPNAACSKGWMAGVFWVLRGYLKCMAALPTFRCRVKIENNCSRQYKFKPCNSSPAPNDSLARYPRSTHVHMYLRNRGHSGPLLPFTDSWPTPRGAAAGTRCVLATGLLVRAWLPCKSLVQADDAKIMP